MRRRGKGDEADVRMNEYFRELSVKMKEIMDKAIWAEELARMPTRIRKDFFQ